MTGSWAPRRHSRQGSQSYHAEFAKFFQSWKGPLVSTEAVLTEASHLLARVPGGPRACCDFFLECGAVLVPSSPLSLRRCRELVGVYHDLPMDYADATLVALEYVRTHAAELGLEAGDTSESQGDRDELEGCHDH